MADCLNVKAVSNERIYVTLDKLCVWCYGHDKPSTTTERCKQVGLAADRIKVWIPVICRAAGVCADEI